MNYDDHLVPSVWHIFPMVAMENLFRIMFRSGREKTFVFLSISYPFQGFQYGLPTSGLPRAIHSDQYNPWGESPIGADDFGRPDAVALPPHSQAPKHRSTRWGQRSHSQNRGVEMDRLEHEITHKIPPNTGLYRNWNGSPPHLWPAAWNYRRGILRTLASSAKAASHTYRRTGSRGRSNTPSPLLPSSSTSPPPRSLRRSREPATFRVWRRRFCKYWPNSAYEPRFLYDGIGSPESDSVLKENNKYRLSLFYKSFYIKWYFSYFGIIPRH